MLLTPDAIARFRERYVALFGAADRDDLLYEAVSEGRRYAGMEHWLPLFPEGLETLFDYVGDAPVVLDHLADEAVDERLDQIADHYEARRPGDGRAGHGRRRALQAAAARARSTSTASEWAERLAARPVAPALALRRSPRRRGVIDLGGAQRPDLRRRARAPATSTSSTP